MTHPAPVQATTDGPVATIVLDRPHCRNAVDGPAAALRAAFEAFEADDTLALAALAGAGGHFCAGARLLALGDPERANVITHGGRGHNPMGMRAWPSARRTGAPRPPARVRSAKACCPTI